MPSTAKTRGSGRARRLAAVDGLFHCKHLERRVLGRDGPKFVVAGVWPGALEENPDLGLPSLQVSAQHRHLLIVSEFPAAKDLGALAQTQLARTDRPQVADPLGLAAGCHKVPAALMGEEVHWCSTPLPAGPALHCKDPRPEHTDALPGQKCHELVEDIAREPARRAVVI